MWRKKTCTFKEVFIIDPLGLVWNSCDINNQGWITKDFCVCTHHWNVIITLQVELSKSWDWPSGSIVLLDLFLIFNPQVIAIMIRTTLQIWLRGSLKFDLIYVVSKCLTARKYFISSLTSLHPNWDKFKMMTRLKENKTGVINDPLGQTNNLASSEHCFRLKFVLFWKVGTDGRTDGRTDDMCRNNDHYRPWLWVGLVDQL